MTGANDILAYDFGDVINYHGQKYESVSTRPYKTKDGRDILLMRWRSGCATCGALIEVETPEVFVYFRPTRCRCDKHKRPGQKVRKLVCA